MPRVRSRLPRAFRKILSFRVMQKVGEFPAIMQILRHELIEGIRAVPGRSVMESWEDTGWGLLSCRCPIELLLYRPKAVW